MDDRHCGTCTCYEPLPSPSTNRKGKHHRPPGGEEEANAILIAPRSGFQRRAVLDAIAHWHSRGGITDVAGAEWLGIYHQSWLGRCGELMDDGWIQWGDLKSPTGNGGHGRHRILTPRGEAQYQALGE
jgi:hypothetical protein